MFAKLNQIGNTFHITKSTPFSPQSLVSEQILKVFDFAFDMTFGGVGQHRPSRSGGQHARKNGELFCNTFQGKLAEFAVYNELINLGWTLAPPDLSKWALGKWDDTDLHIGDKKISIKSAAFFSNLLLLETKDWDANGVYLPNNTTYHKTILVRIKPDIKNIFKQACLLYCNNLTHERARLIVLGQDFKSDIPGYITLQDLKYIIANHYILPQNSLLNGKVKMDASNYYLQSGDLRKISTLPALLNLARPGF